MKTLLTFLTFLAFAFTAAAATDTSVYELRTYTAEPGKAADLFSRLEGAAPLFKKHGMVPVIFWQPLNEADAVENTIVYVLKHKSRESAGAGWKAFSADPDWIALRDRNEAQGKVVTKVESVFLTPTDYSPEPTAAVAKPGTVYELRTYTTPEGKLSDLDTRFRDHTLKLFEKHGMVNGPYFHPMDADKGANNTLVYWLAHESKDAATASWKAFGSDPAWVEARTASEKNGKLTTKVKSLFLRPLSFSPAK